MKNIILYLDGKKSFKKPRGRNEDLLHLLLLLKILRCVNFPSLGSFAEMTALVATNSKGSQITNSAAVPGVRLPIAATRQPKHKYTM